MAPAALTASATIAAHAFCCTSSTQQAEQDNLAVALLLLLLYDNFPTALKASKCASFPIINKIKWKYIPGAHTKEGNKVTPADQITAGYGETFCRAKKAELVTEKRNVFLIEYTRGNPQISVYVSRGFSLFITKCLVRSLTRCFSGTDWATKEQQDKSLT